MLVVFDDEKAYREAYRENFPKMGIKMEVTECSSKEEIRKVLQDAEIMKLAKVLVFDLSTSKEEAESLTFEILSDIEKNYHKYPIPIFIHSAFAHKVDGFDNLGTMFKIKKGASSVEQILTKIELFYKSGFLDIFSPGGSVEKQIHLQILAAFNEQFKGEEVESIIKSIKHANGENFQDRVKSVFERIAIRSLYQNLLSAKRQPETNQVEEIQINAVEHYYRRKSDFKVWTGDLFINKNDKSQLIVLTPRCDINNGVCNGNYLVCNIEPIDEKKRKEFSKDKNAIRNYLTDNPQNTGLKYRFLVPTAIHEGGRINLTSFFIAPELELVGDKAKYEYLISLSDELTNDIVRKFASYLLRSGISSSELAEASYYSLGIEEEK